MNDEMLLSCCCSRASESRCTRLGPFASGFGILNLLLFVLGSEILIHCDIYENKRRFLIGYHMHIFLYVHPITLVFTVLDSRRSISKGGLQRCFDAINSNL